MILTNVRIKNLLAGLMILIILLSLCACAPEKNTEEPSNSTDATEATEQVIYDKVDFLTVTNFYLSYLKRETYDPQGAFREYKHFEQDWLREALDGVYNPITGYEIHGVKKLNNQLWVIHVSTTSVYEPEWDDYHHFVGLVDGKLYVMINQFNVPAELKEGLDLSEYHKEGIYDENYG